MRLLLTLGLMAIGTLSIALVPGYATLGWLAPLIVVAGRDLKIPAPGDGKKSAADRELAIQQIVSRAVVSTEIVDIMKAAGLESPDISRPVSRRSARHRKEEPRY